MRQRSLEYETPLAPGLNAREALELQQAHERSRTTLGLNLTAVVSEARAVLERLQAVQSNQSQELQALISDISEQERALDVTWERRANELSSLTKYSDFNTDLKQVRLIRLLL